MKTILTISLILLSLSMTQAFFTYKVESRKFNKMPQGYTDNDYGYDLRDAALAAPQPHGFCTKYNPSFPIQNQKLCPGGKQWDIFWIIEIEFKLKKAAKFNFQIGTDFGLGGAVFIDDSLHFATKKDLWWNNDWNSNAVINVSKKFSAGSHTIVIYGAEKCCDGPMNIRYKKDHDKYWKVFNPNNLNCDSSEILAQNTVETKKLPYYHHKNDINFGNKLRDDYNESEQPQGYCTIEHPSWPISNHKNCYGPRSDIFFLYEIGFDIPKATWLQIQLGVDLGKGYAVFINDKFHSSSKDDLWWGGSYANTKEIITISKDFPKGWHSIKIYGREKCCDGAQSARFRISKTGHYHLLTKANFLKAIPYSNIDIKVHTRKLVIQPYEHVKITPPKFQYLFGILPQPKGYCKVKHAKFPVENSQICPHGSNTNILWKITIDFFETQSADYIFQLGADFGKGVIVYVNGKVVVNRSDDIWWYHNWNAKSEIVNFDLWTPAKQVNNIEIYGAEGCCDGQNDIRFSRNGSKYQSINELPWAIPSHKCDYNDYHYYK